MICDIENLLLFGDYIKVYIKICAHEIIITLNIVKLVNHKVFKKLNLK